MARPSLGKVAPFALAVFGCVGCRTSRSVEVSTHDGFHSHRGDLGYGWDEHLALHIGRRRMDDAFLPGAGNDLVVGIEISGAPPELPLDFVLGIFGSGSWGSTFASDQGTGLTFGGGEAVSTGAGEISLGARIAPVFGRVRPYAGLGIAGIRAHRRDLIGDETLHRSDSSAAGYWHAGIEYLGRGGWTFGLHVRELFGSDLTLGGLHGDADYTQFTLSLGTFL